MNDSQVDTWATAISTNTANGRRIIFRYAEELSPSFEKATQPDRVIIVWKYASEDGQPIPDECNRMSVLEDSLEQALRGDWLATLADLLLEI
jgi:hypothetical protein